MKEQFFVNEQSNAASTSWNPQGSQGGNSAPAPVSFPEPPTEDTRNHSIEEGLDAWGKQMDLYTGPDALLDFNQVDYVHIDITDANPSGLAQLMMGRKTRLSTIIRDKSKLQSAMDAAQTLRSKIFELETHHGLSAGYFAAGTASWLSRSVQKNGMMTEKRFIAPILLAPVSISVHPTSNDFEIKLTGAAQLNPAMVRQINKEYGINLENMDIAELANSMSKLDPEPVIDRMRTSVNHIPGMMIESKYLISTFADVKESTSELPDKALTPLVQNLAQLALEPEDTMRPEVFVNNSALDVDHRDPENEMLVFDADAASQDVIDLATAGHSLVVTSASGTEPLETAANIAASLMSRGKSVLVVGEKSSTVEEFSGLIKSAGMQELTLDLLSESTPENLRDLMVRAIVRNEQVAEPNMRETFETLKETRERLANHTAALKFTESRWGCSVYDALQTLAALTAQEEAPATSIRFSREVLDNLTDRADVTEKLQKLADLAAFKPSTHLSAWKNAKLITTDECKAAHELVISLRDSMESLHRKMSALCAETGMRLGRTLEEWTEQLYLLERIGDTLTRFRVDVYDRPVTDLMAATASGSWRREHGVEMSSIQRSRLRKAAKEYILPGIHIGDLHETLQIIQSQREEWISWAEDPREPSVPAETMEIKSALRLLKLEFSGLEIVLEDSPEGNEFESIDVSIVLQRLMNLEADYRNLMTLPERDQLTAELKTQGLEALMSDLLERQVPRDLVGAELELAWWQSALEMMMSSQELEILDGATLRELEGKFRMADSAHIAAGAARLSAAIARNWNHKIAQDTEGSAYLKSQLTGHEFRFDQLLENAPGMATALYPLWITSPFALSRRISPQMRFDCAILLDAESSPMAANLPAITRADQVIALGDPHSGFPAPFMVSAVAKSAPVDTDHNIVSTYSALSKILPKRTLSLLKDRAVDPAVFAYLNEHFYDGKLRAYPWGEEISQTTPAFIAEYLDSTGKISDNSNLDSPEFEVQRVAQRVLEHAYKNPNQSLAVVTASPRHARRIAESVRSMLAQYPQMAPFFSGGREPFRVVDLARAGGMVRDVIIFSLGTGIGRQGAVNHQLGQLSEEHGRELLVLGLSRARHLTRFMACVQPKDLDPERLEYGARDLYNILRDHEAYLERQGLEQTATITDKIPANEFLKNTDIEAIDMGDWLLNDMVRRLHDRGVKLRESEYDNISLVALSSEESLMAGSTLSPRQRKMGTGTPPLKVNLPLAAISDGSEEFARMSVRERSRLVPDRLSKTGWNYLTLWTIEVFSDPESVVDRMCLYLGIEGADDDAE